MRKKTFFSLFVFKHEVTDYWYCHEKNKHKNKGGKNVLAFNSTQEEVEFLHKTLKQISKKKKIFKKKEVKKSLRLSNSTYLPGKYFAISAQRLPRRRWSW